MTYQAVAINPSSFFWRGGVQICDDVADCGHNHKSIDAACACLSRLTSRGSLLWLHAQVRDSKNNPICLEDYYMQHGV